MIIIKFRFMYIKNKSNNRNYIIFDNLLLYNFSFQEKLLATIWYKYTTYA